jgi:hypothetical protein
MFEGNSHADSARLNAARRSFFQLSYDDRETSCFLSMPAKFSAMLVPPTSREKSDDFKI